MCKNRSCSSQNTKQHKIKTQSILNKNNKQGRKIWKQQPTTNCPHRNANLSPSPGHARVWVSGPKWLYLYYSNWSYWVGQWNENNGNNTQNTNKKSEPKPKQRWWPQQHFSSFGVKNQEPQGIGAMKKRGQSIQPANLTGAALENCSAPLHTKLTRMLRNGNAQKTTDSGATADGTGVTFNYANKRNQLFNNSFK